MNTIVVTIPDYKVPSWNTFYSGKHWSTRKRMADEAHVLVASELPSGARKFKRRVHIFIHAFYKSKVRRDPDNVCSKILIDGLVGEVLEDDNSQWVDSVTTKVTVGADSDYVEITLLPLSQ